MGVWVTVEAETEYITQLLRGIQRPHRPERALLHALQALAPDRPGGRHVGGQRRAARRSRPAWPPAGTPTSWPPPSATCSPASCSTAKAATPSGASCCRPRPRRAWAACRSGLAHDVKVMRPVKKGQSLSWADVAMDTTTAAYKVRREMEALFAAPLLKTAYVIDLADSRRARLFDGSGARAAARRRRGRRRPDRAPSRRASADADARRASIDADGLALMPGIIDSHTHFDAQITWDPTLAPSPALGVTTAVIGNCGFTIAPCRPADRELTMRNLTQVEGMSIDALRARHRLGLRDLPRVPGAAARTRLASPTSPPTSAIRRCAPG